MRSFNSNFNIERAKRGTAPLNVLELSFYPYVYLSDRDLTLPGDVACQGLVSGWGFLDTSAAQVAGAGLLGQIEVADLRLELINHGGVFSDYFASSSTPLEAINVTLYQWFEGMESWDAEVLFLGVVGGQPEYDLRTCSLTIRSIWSRYNKRIGDDKIITAAFPGADPDDIGQMRNMLWGTCRNVKCRAVAAGMVDLLRDDLTAAATSFYLSGSTPANMASGTKVVQIDGEQISGTWSPSTRQLTSCTRGYNSTTAVAHDKGSSVAEVLTSYVYELASHPVKTIGAVRVDGVAQASGYTAYTGQSGDELSGYEGTAVIKFTARPAVSKQVNLVLSEDTLAVSTGSHSHSVALTQAIVPTSASLGGSFSGTAANVYDQSDVTYVYGDPEDGASAFCTASFPAYSGPTPSAVYMCVTHKSVKSATGARVYVESSNSSTETDLDTSNVKVTQKISCGTTVPNNFFVGISTTYGKNALCYVYEMWLEISTNSSGESAANGVALTGDNVTLSGNSSADTVIGKVVTVDVDGYQDDASGTITGTANALIERPDHLFADLWINTLGAPDYDIDSTTFTAAGSFYNTNTYKFGLAITQPIMADELLLRLALQCRSRFIVSPAGKARLLVRQTGQSSGHAIPKAEIKRDSVRMRRSSWEDLINAFTILYDRDHGEADGVKSYAGATAFSDSTSITAYGRREWRGQENLFWFDAVSDSAMVAHVGAFYLAWHKTPRSMPMFSVFLDNMEIEPGDVIDVTHDLDGMSGFACEVAKIRHNIGSGRKKLIDHLEIQAVEV